ncbi:MAG TPA: glycosyltransferase family 9 protein, partial [Tepidisphaeraceae bacterium]|nr:glycosyltransferase family 9 protein [Tepidisphaeraceae bacterium]
QFIRYVPMVAERGARVVLLSHQPKLLPLLKQIPGVARIITEAWEQPQYDVQCSLLALPRLFKTTVATIPRGDAYLKADPALTATWADRLIALNKPGKRVGIVWAGNPDHRNDRNRSMPLEALLPLGEMVGITLYSLQKGPAAAQLAASPALGAKLIDIAPQLNDFADTAAAIVNLDLIISVDTSVAHVAGAMGKPVWLLLPLSPDWRWMLDRADSPWYPSMRLFRQRRLGDWAGVAADVAQAIDQLD